MNGTQSSQWFSLIGTPVRAKVIQEDCMTEAVHLMIGYKDGRKVSYITALGGEAGVVVEQPVDSHVVGPTFAIPREVAKALLDALAEHFGGTGDTRQLRKDYDAERGRVDRLIGALLTPPLPDKLREA